MEFHFSAAETGNVNVVHWQVQVQQVGQTGFTANSYYAQHRNQIFKRDMEMLPVNVATVFKRIVVVRVPKKWARVSDGMIIRLIYQASSTQQINACGFAIYKEFY